MPAPKAPSPRKNEPSAALSVLGLPKMDSELDLFRAQFQALLDQRVLQARHYQKYKQRMLHGPGCAVSNCSTVHVAIAGTSAVTDDSNAATQIHKHQHNHEHSHGGVVIDLDEAVHGASAVMQYVTQALQGNPTEIGAQLTKDVKNLESDPVRFSGLELVQGGMAQTIAGMATSVAMLPLAGLAMHAGWEEFHHAKHELKDVEARLTVLQDREAILRAGELVMKDTITPVKALVHAYGKSTQAECKSLERAKKFARWDKRIGVASFTSGLFIALKAGADLALKLVMGAKSGKDFFAMGDVAQATVAASTATTAVGVAGTVMGPVAGLASTVLGAYMWHKSTRKLKHLQHSFPSALKRLQWTIPIVKDRSQHLTHAGALRDIPESFMSFMTRQGKKRIGFFKRFAFWNKLFTLGSGFYTASALTKALVIALAAALASNPVGLGVLVGVGILGAIVMGVGSFCFFYGHGKQSKYVGHTHEETQWVNRSMVVRHAHMASAVTGDQKDELSLASEALSLVTFNHLETRKLGMHGLWSHVAEQSKKVSQHNKEQYKNLPIWKKILTPRIGTKDFEKNLFEKSSEKIILSDTIKQFAIVDLSARLQVIEKELHGLCAELSMLPDGLDTSINAAIQQCRTAVFEKASLLKDEYGYVSELKNELVAEGSNFSTNNEFVLDLLNYWGVAVVYKPGIGNGLDIDATMKALIKHFSRGMDEDLRKARGVLFEAQLDIHCNALEK